MKIKGSNFFYIYYKQKLLKARWLYMALVFWWNVVYSQQFPNIQFNYLTEKEGLSNNEVGYITQDQQGFIWIGTLDGLNRFDGYRVRRFYHNPANENSLINNSVYHIIPDRENHLWITTREGLSIYNKKTGAFNDLVLTVDTYLIGEYIHYRVQDNGVSRKLSTLYNHKNKPNHKSPGLAITEQRIHIFNQEKNANGRVTITDLFDENNHPSGTKVEIMIKAV
jgi:Two component regulator propeller